MLCSLSAVTLILLKNALLERMLPLFHKKQLFFNMIGNFFIEGTVELRRDSWVNERLFPIPEEPIQSWMAHLTQSSWRGPRGTCHIHIKALENALFVCVRDILSCRFCRSHSVDTAIGSHCACVGLVFQVKLSFNSTWNWEWQQQGSAQGPGPLLSIKPSQCCKVSSCNEPCHRYHCTNIPTTQHAYWLQIVSASTRLRCCVYVMYVCTLT